MGRIIAFDYGTKRTGIATTDTMQIIATNLQMCSDIELIPFLKVYLDREDVDCFVVGEPKQMDNTPSQSYASVMRFCGILKKNFPELDVYLTDERFTSKIASQTIAKNVKKQKKKQDKGLIDEISAILILQSFMNTPIENRKKYDPTNS